MAEIKGKVAEIELKQSQTKALEQMRANNEEKRLEGLGLVLPKQKDDKNK